MTLRAIQRYSKTGDSKTGVICRGATQDLSPRHSVLEGVRAREAPPIPEGLQTVTGGWGNGCHFLPWCSHWSIGSPVLVHLSPTFMQVTKQTLWVSLAPQKHLDSKKCNKLKGKKKKTSQTADYKATQSLLCLLFSIQKELELRALVSQQHESPQAALCTLPTHGLRATHQDTFCL